LVFVLFSLGLFTWSPRASAKTGHAADPVDDVYDGRTETRGPGSLDIFHAMHQDDAVNIKYTLKAIDGFANDFNAIHWYLEVPGVQAHGCAPIAIHVEPRNDVATGQLVRCVGPGRFAKLADAKVVHKNGAANLSVSIPIAALRKAGMTGGTYTYTVWASASKGVSDDVPNGEKPLTHVLSAPVPASTPRPAPKVAPPTVAATARPTKEPTPEPTVAPVAIPRAKSFAAPDEAESNSTNAPLRAIAVFSVIAGAGAVLLLSRQF
jgi:hypothetical protein